MHETQTCYGPCRLCNIDDNGYLVWQQLITVCQEWKVQLINGKPYTLLSVIGRGGSSKVYEAIGPDMKICGVKCVNLDADDEQMVASYCNEISLLQRLQHCSQIVRLIDQYDPNIISI